MKSVHKSLKLRHHKHTGKLLPHKHTSYRVLFLLMLAPIMMLGLVGQLAAASDLEVSATVPPPPPSAYPTITSPKDDLPPFVAFIQQNLAQIYIVTLSCLCFLWYIEHGRHIVVATPGIAKGISHRHRHHHR